MCRSAAGRASSAPSNAALPALTGPHTHQVLLLARLSVFRLTTRRAPAHAGHRAARAARRQKDAIGPGPQFENAAAVCDGLPDAAPLQDRIRAGLPLRTDRDGGDRAHVPPDLSDLRPVQGYIPGVCLGARVSTAPSMCGPARVYQICFQCKVTCM
jgi:hypothetical protein